MPDDTSLVTEIDAHDSKAVYIADTWWHTMPTDISVAIDIAHDTKTADATDLNWYHDELVLPLTFGLAPTQCQQ